MIGRYALSSDDLIDRLQPTITASAVDAAYPVQNWLDSVRPSKPSKLTTTTGWWEFDFGSAVNAAVFAAIYHNFDAGLSVVLKWNSTSSWGSPAGSQSLTVPAWTEDGWTVSPWNALAGTPTYRYWRLEVALTGPANTEALSLGRPLLAGALRDIGSPLSIGQDVRWGVEEIEEHGLIEQPTELGVETIYALGGKRRRFSGELALQNATVAPLLTLHRAAGGRVLPWLLIPDVDVNDAWVVRFEENRWSRVRETIGHNIFPFRVQELSRGLPWP